MALWTRVEVLGKGCRGEEGGEGQGCIRREGTLEAAPEAVGQAVGGGCQSGWGRLLSVTNATTAGACHHGESLGIGWAAWRGRLLYPFQCIPSGGGGVTSHIFVRLVGGYTDKTSKTQGKTPPPPPPPPPTCRVLCPRSLTLQTTLG